MAKNIKLKDLLNEQDPRIAGYTTPKDRYFMSPDAAFDKLTKGAEKAAGKDSTDVSPEYTGKARLNALAGKAYKAPNGLEYPQYVIGGIPNKFATVSDDVFVLDLSATPTYPLLKANPPKLSSADAKIIVNKGRTEPMQEYDIEQIAEKIYNTKGYFRDDEKVIISALDTYRKGIQTRGDLAYLENTFANNYGKSIEDYIYEYSERDVSERLLKWLQGRTWMTTDVLQRWGDSLDRINDWALTSGTINDFFLWAISPTRRKFLEDNFARRSAWYASHSGGADFLGWLKAVATGGADISDAVWIASSQPGNESQLLPFDVSVHDILEGLSFIVSFVPIVGFAISAGIDLIDAGVYAVEGDTYSAGMAAMFAALPFMPNVSGPLKGVLKKFSKTELQKFGAKLGKGLTAETYMKLSRRELELLYAVEKDSAKLLKAFDDKIVAGMAKNSDELNKIVKSGSKSQQTKFAKALSAAKNSKTAKAAANIAEQNLIMTAAEWAWRKANQVTDAEMQQINQEILQNVTNKWNSLLSAPVAESVSNPWYSKYMKSNTTNKRNSISLTNLLEDIFSEQNVKYIPIRRRDDYVDQPNTSTIGKKKDTTAQIFVGGDTDKPAKPEEAAENAAIQAESDAGWIDAETLTYIVAIGGTAFVGWRAGKVFLQKLGKRFTKIKDWWRFIKDYKKVKEALEEANLVLTKKEYRAMCKEADNLMQEELTQITNNVISGKLTPEQALKQVGEISVDAKRYGAGYATGDVERQLQYLKRKYKSGTNTGATGTTSGTSGAYGRSNIGFGRSGD